MNQARAAIQAKYDFTDRTEDREGWCIPRGGDRARPKGEGIHYARSMEALYQAKFATLDAKVDEELGVESYGNDRRARPHRMSHQGIGPYAGNKPRGKVFIPFVKKAKSFFGLESKPKKLFEQDEGKLLETQESRLLPEDVRVLSSPESFRSLRGPKRGT